jgi:hypothetical protein
MLATNEGSGNQDKNQQQLGISDGAAHGQRYPFIEEFSEFLSSVSTQALKYKLMTYQQRLFAKALWEAENFGGSRSKCEARLKEIYGFNWKSITKVADHMVPEREYCEYVLILEHQKQWNEAQQKAKLQAFKD